MPPEGANGENEDLMVERMPLEVGADTAAVHMEAFRGYMNAELGARYANAFLGWFSSEPSAIALIVRRQGQVVGYVAGAPEGYQPALTAKTASAVAAAIASRPRLLLRGDIRDALMARLKNQLLKRADAPHEAPLPAPVMALVGIGVTSRARRRGVGSALLHAFEMESQRRGMRAIRLSAYRNNETARSFYDRNGWTLLDSGRGSTIHFWKPLDTPDQFLAES